MISCEHAGNRVPPEYGALFVNAAAELDSHRGFDVGALQVAETLAASLGAPLARSRMTRLLIDLNRSAHHPKLYSEFSRELSAESKRELLSRYYTPYRRRVESLVAAAVARGAFVLHVSCHSFTPMLADRVRDVDLGLLYDPRRPAEKALAAEWVRGLRAAAPELRVRRNYPYRGAADGLTTHLRRRFAADDYAGLELEVNQRRVGSEDWSRDLEMLVASLECLLVAGLPDGAVAERRDNRRR